MNKVKILILAMLISGTALAQKTIIEPGVFKVVYSEEYQQPLSLEYLLQCPDGTASRKGMNFFKVDSVNTSDNADYRNNVWDKGHLAPAAAFNCDLIILKKTFSYLNCALQHQGLNRGPWKELEKYERNLAKLADNVYVIITVHFNESGLLSTGARVPTGFTKEITIDEETMISFYFPNIDLAGMPFTQFKTN